MIDSSHNYSQYVISWPGEANEINQKGQKQSVKGKIFYSGFFFFFILHQKKQSLLSNGLFEVILSTLYSVL